MTDTDDARRIRRIRSFVRRPGRTTAAQRRAFAELWPRFGIDPDEQELDLDATFGRRGADRVLEIGYGDGTSLVELAASRPDADFLGIEVHEPGIGHCLLAIEAGGLANLRLIARDATDILRSQLAANSLTRINLYFPDPWPKKRHHKRRIVSPGFLDLAARCLRPGGTLHIATDWTPYAEHIAEVLANDPRFRLLEHREHGGEAPLERATTRFERRGLRLGHRIHDWKLQRIEPSPAV